MKLGRKDIFWNYAATFMRLASGIVILPLVVKILPAEEYAIWGIFLTVSSIPALLDLGFSNSFSRNIAYIFSGATELKAKGYIAVIRKDAEIDYGLLKTVIKSMQTYYGIMALVFITIFFIGSPFYMSAVLAKYSGAKTEIWVAWFTYGALVAYEFYTCYYNSLMSGRGLIKRNMQIVIISQTTKILVSIICLFFGWGIISLVIGILVSDLINRTLSYYSFYDKQIKEKLIFAIVTPVKDIIKIMAPNSFKIGLTTLGLFAMSQAITLISPFYLTLPEVGQYTISKLMMSLIISMGGTWFGTFYPQLTQYRVRDENENIKRLYVKGLLVLIIIFVAAGSGLLLIGNPLLKLIHSKTMLLNNWILLLMLFFSFCEAIQSISTSTLLTKNEVPYFKSVLISGGASLILLFILFKFTTLGVLSMILAPGITLTLYQNWKWPYMVIKELKIKPVDFKNVTIETLNTLVPFKKKQTI